MGIPSYFAYLIKNHPDILKKIKNQEINNKSIDCLYLDSNSLIYESYYEILDMIKENNFEKTKTGFERSIILNVIKKLKILMNDLNVFEKRVIIAFDGVAPFAKLNQQKNRRYKSALQNKILKKKEYWNKSSITPGTNFMKKLTKKIKSVFNKNKNIIVSGPDECGEGEHKIFSYIRENPILHKDDTIVIYGLDADLIMLCLNHLHISKNIYLYRETPDFIKSINKDLEPNEKYILDIPELAKFITLELNNYKKPTTAQEKNKLFDYIFMCFFLGNDFMPHFPSLNIRSSGIHVLKSIYNNFISKKNKNLTDGNEIFWENVSIFINALAENEYDRLKEEYKHRNKQERYEYTYENELQKWNNIPLKNRDREKYIDVNKSYWQNRYYNILFDCENSALNKKEICKNYLEGLEWNMKYYTKGCVDWSWSYKYNYAPLFIDLKKYTPKWEVQFLEEKEEEPVEDIVQLSYVLPETSYDLLPKTIVKKMRENDMVTHLNCEIEWSFCRYFWESHVKFKDISIEKYKNLIK